MIRDYLCGPSVIAKVLIRERQEGPSLREGNEMLELEVREPEGGAGEREGSEEARGRLRRGRKEPRAKERKRL